MSGDPIHTAQQIVWRLGALFRRGRLKGETRAWDYERGRALVDDLVQEVQARTGSSVEGRRALDYGCGAGRLALPLAKRCEHVHGLDIDPGVLRLAESNARDQSVTNVSWGESKTLPELHGQYDLLLSMNVLQHIASREGERTFRTLLRGLQPGGIGVVQVLLRPPIESSRLLEREYLYELINSYSLKRLGGLLFDEGISPWHAKARKSESAGAVPMREVTFFFQKP